MKINLEVDCTPEEARRAMGLPDLAPVHEHYVQLLLDTMNGKGSPELLEGLFRQWAPMGEASMTMWRKLFESAGQKG